MTTTTARIYGIAEIAQALGRSPGLVAQWHHRHKLPEPDWRVAAGPFWRAATIEPWIAEQNAKAG